MSKEVKQSYYQAHREVVIARAKAHAAANPEKHAAYAKAWRQRNPDKVFAKRLRERFNLTVEQFEAMRREQDTNVQYVIEHLRILRTLTTTTHVVTKLLVVASVFADCCAGRATQR
jgi:TPP-dependent pyruvate/acetoin dehydrogenase alpha subunit